MTRTTWLAIGLWLFAAGASAWGDPPAADSSNAKPAYTIVAFGDSITASAAQANDKKWPKVLETRLQQADPSRRFQVVNAGVGGNTSREGLARLERDVLTHKPDLVVIEFGGNDATDNAARHVDLKEFEKNLTTMLEKTRAVNPRAMIVIATFPPVVDSKHSAGKLYGGLDKYIEQYRVAARQFAKAHELPLVDMDAAIRPQSDQYILPDGVHLTDGGNEAIAKAVDAVIRKVLAIRN